jgi:hypothetical protein
MSQGKQAKILTNDQVAKVLEAVKSSRYPNRDQCIKWENRGMKEELDDRNREIIVTALKSLANQATDKVLAKECCALVDMMEEVSYIIMWYD